MALRNAVNRDDVLWFASNVTERAPKLLRKLTSSDRQRTIDDFSTVSTYPQWWDVPAVQRRWNTLVTGSADTDIHSWLADQFLSDGGHVGVSVGCGSGQRELSWARTGVFETLIGVDLTPPLVENAREAASSAGLADVLRFEVADVTTGPPGGARPDVLIGEHSIHHFAPLPEMLRGFRDMLAPGGLLLIDEFVGPNRFQWTDDQLECTNALLHLLPERLRMQPDGRIKKRIPRPSLLYMRLKDPSEAIQSELILPLLDELFECRLMRPYGGTVLHILLAGIAHNFADEDDAEAQEWLGVLMDTEDRLLEEGRIDSDFVVAVYEKA